MVGLKEDWRFRMAKFRVYKTFMLKPDNHDPKFGAWYTGSWVSQIDDSDTLWEFTSSNAQSASDAATAKADELNASNDGRKYRIQIIEE